MWNKLRTLIKMGRRYGRNQRRRHRERIAELEAQVELSGYLSQKVRRLEGLITEWDQRICWALGNESFFRAEPPKIASRNPIRRRPIAQRLSVLDYAPDSGPIKPLDVVVEDLYRFTLVAEAQPLHLRRYLKIVETNDCGVPAAICMSEGVYHEYGFTPSDRQFFAEEIAFQLTEFVNQGRG